METISLRDAAYRVIRDADNQDSIGWNESFATALGQEMYDLDWEKAEGRIKCYWLHRWYCTDSYVGARVYYFDDEPLAVSIQTGRKSSEDFYFLDRDRTMAARDFIRSCVPEPYFVMLDDEKQIALRNPVSYLTQLLDYEGLVDGQPVTLDRKVQHEHTKGKIVTTTLVMPDGEVRPIKDFLIPLKINP